MNNRNGRMAVWRLAMIIILFTILAFVNEYMRVNTIVVGIVIAAIMQVCTFVLILIFIVLLLQSPYNRNNEEDNDGYQ